MSPSYFKVLFYPRKFYISYTSTVGAHGCLVLKLTKGVRATPPSFTFYYAAASSNTLTGTAAQRVVNSTVTVVGNIGNGSTLTINGVDGGKKGGTKTVSLDYINGDVAFYNTACSNCRNVFISVNGGSAVQVQMPISGQVSHLFGCLSVDRVPIAFIHRAGISCLVDILCLFLDSNLEKLTRSSFRTLPGMHQTSTALGCRCSRHGMQKPGR